MKKGINFHGVEVEIVFAEGSEDLYDHTMMTLRLMASRVYEARGILHAHFSESSPMIGDDAQAVAFNRIRSNVLAAENTIPWTRLSARNCTAYVERKLEEGVRVIAFKAEIGPIVLEIVSTVSLKPGMPQISRVMTVEVLNAPPKERKPKYELPAGLVAGIVAAGDARIEAIDKSIINSLQHAMGEAIVRSRRILRWG